MRKKGKAFKVLAFSLAVMIGCSNMPQIAYATDELVTEVTETEPEVIVVEPEVVVEEIIEEPVIEEQPEEIIEEVVDEPVVESSEAVVEQPEVIDEVTENVVEKTTESIETTEGEITDEEVIETTTESVETVVDEISYIVTFVDADGNELNSMEVKDVSEITLPEAPEKEGFTFVKWDIDLEALELTEDITVTPIYEEIEVMEEAVKFIITFIDAEENVISTQEVEKVEEIELPEAPIKEGYNFVNWDIDLESLELTENITIKPIYEEVETILVEKTLEKTVDDKVISIIGNMPENAEIVVNKVTYTQSIEKNIEETLDGEVIVTVYEAFDIKIKVDDEEYQPNEFDESVVVSIKNIEVEEKEGEELKVFHIDDSNNIEEVVATVDTETSEAEFEADSFSVYVVAGVEYNTDNGTLLDNTYATAYLYDDGTLLVTEFKGNIPAATTTAELYPWYSVKDSITNLKFADTITYIDSYAFRGFNNISGELILPTSLSEIRTAAFSGCSGFTGSLIIPDSVTDIGECAFANCSGFNGTLSLSNGLTEIQGGVFYNCSGFSGELVIPNSVTVIKARNGLSENIGTFEGCSGFTSLDLGTGITWIQPWAFKNCTGFTGELIIPDTVTAIGFTYSGSTNYGESFSGCTGFTSLKLGNSVKNIFDKSFYGCTGMKGDLVIPDSTVLISNEAFRDCTGFDGVLKLGNNLTTISDGAFRNCQNLSGDLVIPNNVTTLGIYAFRNCKGFTGTLTLSENLTEIAGGAFCYCSGFTGDLVIPNSVTKICHYDSWGSNEGAFEGCSGFDGNLILGNGITWITNRAFKDCSGFTGTLRIPTSCLYIGNTNKYDGANDNVGAFSGCTGFTALELNEGLLRIFSYSFNGCTGFANDLVLPSTLDTIGAYAFNECSSLTGDLNIPNGVTVISERAFRFCSSLDGVLTIPEGVKTIGNRAFSACYELKGDLIIPDTVTVINENAFMSCYNLGPNLVIGAGFDSSSEYIYKNAFYDCYGISNIDVSDACTTIYRANNGNHLMISSVDNAINTTVSEKAAALNSDVYSRNNLFNYYRLPMTLKFDTDGGNEIADIELFKPQSTMLPVAEKEGYKFNGWKATIEGSSNITLLNTTTNYNAEYFYPYDNDYVVSLVADFTEVTKYTITFDSKGGTDVEEQIIIENEKVTEPTDPTRTGYTFKGWYVPNPAYFSGQEEWNFDTDVVTADTTLYAKWEINKYEVSFDTDDGSAVGNQTIEHNSKAVKPTDPTKTGYDFKGWFKDITLTTEWNFDTDTVTADTVLYAKWEIQKFTVTYKDNDGLTSESTETVEYGSQATKTNPGTVAGYDFKGWLLNGAEYDMSTPVTSNIELVAKWEIQKFAITFDFNGGRAIISSQTLENQTIDYGTTKIVALKPEKYGYTFKGWKDSNGNTYSYTDGTAYFNCTINYTVYSDMYFTAIWERNEYFVSFQTVGGSNVESQYVYEGEKIIKPADPTYGTRDFLGWYDTETLQPWDFDNDVVMHDMSLFAKWGKEKFTVSFDSDGGTTIVSQTIEDGELVVKPTGVIKTKHSLDGWYLGNTKWDFDNDVVTSNITLKAKWTYIPDKYDFSFDSNGGSSVDSQIITEGSTATKPVDPTKKGHTFKGWFTDNTFTTEYDFSDVVTGNTTVIAKWEINSYVISFNTQGGSSVADQTIKYNEKVTEPAEPTKEGYTLKGWFKDPAGLIEWNFDTDVVEEARTIFAVWEINKYTISFDSNGGSIVDSQNITYNETVLKPENPTKEGHTFKCWMLDEVEFDFSTPIRKEINLVAKWEVNSYIISFDSNGGNLVSNQSIIYNEKVIKPVDPIKDGYTFKGWFTDNTFTTEWNFTDNSVSENITLIAKWEINKYTVSFNTDGGSTVGNQTIEHGNKITEPADPTKASYVFKGWFTDNTYTTEWNFDTDTVTADTELVAKWVPAYTIMFDSNGGSVVEAQSVECDTKAEKPADPTKEGYRFKVWMLNGNEFDFNTPITENITLVAEWEEIIYKTVSFVTNNNQTLENVKVEQGTKISGPTGLVKDGFELSGWYTEAEFTNKWDFNNSVNEDITLYAKWTEKSKPIVEEDEPETEDDEPESSSEESEDETETEEPTTEEPTTEEPTTEEPSSEEPEPSSEEPESDEPEPSSEEPESESEDEPESIEPDEEPISIVEEPLLVGSIDDEVDNMKDAMARLVEVVKTVAIVASISLLVIPGILVLLLLLLAWMKRVKVMNDHNTDEYAEDKYEVVYKTSVKTEGNRLAELFKRDGKVYKLLHLVKIIPIINILAESIIDDVDNRVWTLTIPENILAERVTDNFKVVLKKGFCKRYNGEQIVIILENEDEEKVKSLGFIIDKEENEITFTYSDEQ